jgi:hypothetical protein
MKNKELIKKIVRFLKENGLQDPQIQDIKNDLKNMEIEATSNNQTLDEYLGKDYKEFCVDLLEVGYDFKQSDIYSNDQVDILSIWQELLIIMIPSIVISILTFITDQFIFTLYIPVEIIITLIISFMLFSRDKEKYKKFKREIFFVNIIAFLTTLFFALPMLNTTGQGIFDNYYNGIYESLLSQWVKVVEYIDSSNIINLNENIIVINDYIFSFSFVLLIGYAFYTYLFKKNDVKHFMIPLAFIALLLVLVEYFTVFQFPFMGLAIFIFILYYYIKQFLQLPFKNKRYLLYAIAGFFGIIFVLLLSTNIEFVTHNDLYYGEDILFIIKLILIGYLIVISVYTLFNIKQVSTIKTFYTYSNLFIIAYAMFMITSYLYQGIDRFNIEDPLLSWQSIRIINQMAFAAFGYYVIDSLVRRYSNLDNND